jgi:hypothetical protein
MASVETKEVFYESQCADCPQEYAGQTERTFKTRITGFSDFAHRPRKLGLFPPTDEGRKTPTLLGPLEGANVDHCLPSPEDGNRSSFRNVFFF